MGRVYLIRHAEPVLTGVFLGRTDSPLSPTGLKRAERELSRLHVRAVYTSPLSRAMESARQILRPERFTVLADLAEIDYGEWETKGWDEIDCLWPEIASAKRADWLRVTPPGGETWGEFKSRVLAAWETISAVDLFPLAVVAHMAVNAVLAEHLWQYSAAQFFQGYCEILSGVLGKSTRSPMSPIDELE